MGSVNDIEVNQERFDSTIGEMESHGESMANTFEETKNVLKSDLLSTGMTGPTADAFISEFTNRVVNPAEAYIDAINKAKSDNQNVSSVVSETIAKNKSISQY